MKFRLYELIDVLGESRKVTRLAGYGIKRFWPIFKTKLLIFQSKANADEKILCAKIKHFQAQHLEKYLKGLCM